MIMIWLIVAITIFTLLTMAIALYIQKVNSKIKDSYIEHQRKEIAFYLEEINRLSERLEKTDSIESDLRLTKRAKNILETKLKNTELSLDKANIKLKRFRSTYHRRIKKEKEKFNLEHVKHNGVLLDLVFGANKQ